MKKLIAFAMTVVMVFTLAACGGKAEAPATEPSTEPSVEVPGSALEILETVWALYGEDEKFPVIGGDMVNMVDGAPGTYGLEDTESLAYQLLVPTEQAANIDEAASLFHGMMLNNFTCGAFHVTSDASAFADAMVEAVKNNQWMCGMPESMLVVIIGGEYVVMAFGINDAMNPFIAKLGEAYPDAVIVSNEPVA